MTPSDGLKGHRFTSHGNQGRASALCGESNPNLSARENGEIPPQARNDIVKSAVQLQADRLAERGSVENLAGVEDIVGVEGAFEGAHNIETGFACELRQEFLLGQSHAVLARDCAEDCGVCRRATCWRFISGRSRVCRCPRSTPCRLRCRTPRGGRPRCKQRGW